MSVTLGVSTSPWETFTLSLGNSYLICEFLKLYSGKAYDYGLQAANALADKVGGKVEFDADCLCYEVVVANS
jgi:hypothetical protein